MFDMRQALIGMSFAGLSVGCGLHVLLMLALTPSRTPRVAGRRAILLMIHAKRGRARQGRNAPVLGHHRRLWVDRTRYAAPSLFTHSLPRLAMGRAYDWHHIGGFVTIVCDVLRVLPFFFRRQ